MVFGGSAAEETDRVDIERVAKLVGGSCRETGTDRLYAEIAFPGGSSVFYGGPMHLNRAKCLYLA